MGITRQLSELQDVDLELESAQRTLEQITAKLGESKEVVRVRQELAREKDRLEQLRREQRDAEGQADGYAAKLAVVEEKLYSGRVGNPKELASLQHEADILKGQRGRAEDRALELMEQVAQAEAATAALCKEFQEREAAWQEEQKQLQAEAERYRASIADLKERRQQAASDIDPSAVGVYDGIRRQKGWAVARVERGTCRGCGISLSTAQLQQAWGDQLLRCSNCGRILFHV